MSDNDENDVSYLDIYNMRRDSREAFSDYLSMLKYWVRDELSWMIALRRDDQFLLASLIRHVEDGDLATFVDIDYEIVFRTVPDLWRLKIIGVTFERMLRVMYESRSWKCFSILLKDEGFSFWLYQNMMIEHNRDVLMQAITVAVYDDAVLEEMIMHVFHQEFYTGQPEQWRSNFISDIILATDSERGTEGIVHLINILLRNRISISRDTLGSVMEGISSESRSLLVEYSSVWDNSISQ